MAELALRARELSYQYPDGTLGVDGVDLQVRPGERWAFVGANGAGKTTLLHLADGLLTASSGSIEVFHQALDCDESIAVARRRVGFVFQSAEDQLFCPTVLEDVSFGPLHHGMAPAEAESRAREALAEVGLEGFESRVPQHLSSGEKRRVALATVLSMRPDLVLFDEPTTGLDPVGRMELIELLDKQTSSMIIATHDFELVLRLCHRVALLDGGRLVRAGEPRELLFDEPLLEAHGLVMPTWLPYLETPERS